jgi:competence protein ComGC
MKPRLSNQETTALTRIEVLVIVLVGGTLLCLALVCLMQAKKKAGSICCNCNLKQVGIAFRLWEDDHQGKYPMQVSVTNGGAMEWAVDGKNVWMNFLVMSNELSTPVILVCPRDAGRSGATNFSTGFNNANLSYFIGVDAEEAKPQMFLSGDDNFAIGGVPATSGLLAISTNRPFSWTAARHKFFGNIGLADGSVQQLTTSGLQQELQQTGVATNRLAIP